MAAEGRQGSSPDKLAWQANCLQRLFVVNTAQCQHELGWSIACRACSSPKQLEQTWYGSLDEIKLPQQQGWGLESPYLLE